MPGAFGGWLLLLREYGTLRLRDVLGYAIGYAQAGYPLVPAISWSIASVAELFREHWHSSAEVYLPGGGVPAPGTLFANPALAATYRRVLAEAEAASGDRDEQIEAARRAWYDGFVAEEIGKFAATEVMDVTGERHRGLLTADDLASWHARLEAPSTYDYAGLTVCKTGPWGQGPVFLQQLALLKGFDLAAMDPGSAEYIHLVTEAAKLAFADREAWYGDPAFADVPLGELLSDAYNDERRTLISETASAELRPGRPGGRDMELPEFAHGRSDSAEFDSAGRHQRGSGDPGHRPRHRRAARPVVGRGSRRRGAATPATSTSPTGGATWWPRRRAAAGCSPRRSSRRSGSASAPGRRCSRSRPGCPPRSRRASGRGPR